MEQEFIKDLYFRELEGKREQDERTSLHVGVLSVLGGVLLFCYRNFDGSGGWYYLFHFVFGTAVVLFLLAILQVLRANIGHEYERLPLPDEIQGYEQSLREYYATATGVEGNYNDDFNGFLLRHMIAATTRNAQTNLIRSARNYSATRFMGFTVVLAIAGGMIVLASSERNLPSTSVDRVEFQRLVLPDVDEEE